MIMPLGLRGVRRVKVSRQQCVVFTNIICAYSAVCVLPLLSHLLLLLLLLRQYSLFIWVSSKCFVATAGVHWKREGRVL